MLSFLEDWCPCLWWLREPSRRRLNKEVALGEGRDSCSDSGEQRVPCSSRCTGLDGVGVSGASRRAPGENQLLPDEDFSFTAGHSQLMVERGARSSSYNPVDKERSPSCTSNHNSSPRTPQNRGPWSAQRNTSLASASSTQKRNCGIGWNPDTNVDRNTPVAGLYLDQRGEETPDPILQKFLIGGYKTPQIAGKHNSTTRYSPTQRVPIHNTPFERRMEVQINEEKTAMSAFRRRKSQRNYDQ